MLAAFLAMQGPAESVMEGEMATFTLTLSERSQQTEAVVITTQQGTATLGVDYSAAAQLKVLFAPGETVKRFSIPVLAEAVSRTEGLETFFVTATPANSSLSAPLTRQVTIVDAVPKPAVSVSDIAVNEGNAGTTPATFTLTLSSAYPKAVTVAYATRDGSATVANNDYQAASGVVTFLPGQTMQTVSVNVVGDLVLEPNETFSLILSSPTNATIGRGTGTGTILNDEADTPGFQITLSFDAGVTASQRLVFQRAADRWSQIITGDLPSVTDNGTFVDDLLINASVRMIDGVGGILGQAAPTDVRVGQRGLPWKGRMEFDSADVANMEANGTLQSVILHEMGHVIGIGTLWSDFGVLEGRGTADPEFVGANALREYQSIFNLPNAAGVPVENGGGPGTRDGHWRESVFRTELMTGFAEPPGTPMPISRITVGSLQDLGYAVTYAAADPFARPAIVAILGSGSDGASSSDGTGVRPTPAKPITPPTSLPASGSGATQPPATPPAKPVPTVPSKPIPTVPVAPKPTTLPSKAVSTVSVAPISKSTAFKS